MKGIAHVAGYKYDSHQEPKPAKANLGRDVAHERRGNGCLKDRLRRIPKEMSKGVHPRDKKLDSSQTNSYHWRTAARKCLAEELLAESSARRSLSRFGVTAPGLTIRH